jgi:ubiquinone/menaquinone biosynthesis C-methylase UbiE
MNKNVPGNYYDKYHTKNPIAKILMNGFQDSLDKLLNKVEFSTVLDAGCGEGEITNHINNNYKNIHKLKGIELEAEVVQEAAKRFPYLDITQGSIYNLPFSSDSFELVITCEVLEHLDNPSRGIEEIIRVSSRYILVSVPREPIWRVCNLLRGKYINSLGNTPGHLQHWSKEKFISFVSQHARVIDVLSPFPWTMILAEVRK